VKEDREVRSKAMLPSTVAIATNWLHFFLRMVGDRRDTTKKEELYQRANNHKRSIDMVREE